MFSKTATKAGGGSTWQLVSNRRRTSSGTAAPLSSRTMVASWKK